MTNEAIIQSLNYYVISMPSPSNNYISLVLLITPLGAKTRKAAIMLLKYIFFKCYHSLLIYSKLIVFA